MFVIDVIWHLDNAAMTDMSAIQKTRTYLSRIIFLFCMLSALVWRQQLISWMIQNTRDRQILGCQKMGKRLIVLCLAVWIWGSPSSFWRAACWLRHISRTRMQQGVYYRVTMRSKRIHDDELHGFYKWRQILTMDWIPHNRLQRSHFLLGLMTRTHTVDSLLANTHHRPYSLIGHTIFDISSCDAGILYP